MRYITEVNFFQRVHEIENGLPVTKIHVALDNAGDSYIAYGANTGHYHFATRAEVVNWLAGLGPIQSVQNTNPLLAFVSGNAFRLRRDHEG